MQKPTVKHRARSVLLEPCDTRGDVGLDLGRLHGLHVWHVLEVVVPLLDAGGAAEVVERDRRVAPLGKAQRELLVEAVEAADVGEDDDADAARLVGQRRKGREPVAVRRLEHEILVRDGRAGDDGDRRGRVVVEAHRTRDDTRLTSEREHERFSPSSPRRSSDRRGLGVCRAT